MPDVAILSDPADQQLRQDEGRRSHLYTDTRGNFSIGIGRNLQNGLSNGEIELLYINDKITALRACTTNIGAYASLDQVRRDVLLCMAFNLGITKLLAFRMMLAAVTSGEWTVAAAQILNSAAAYELPARYARYASAMERGSWSGGTTEQAQTFLAHHGLA